MAEGTSARIRTPGATVGWPVVMAFVRLPLMLLGAALVWGLLAASGQADGFHLPLGASLAMNLVNIVCLLLLVHLLRREQARLRDLLGFDRARIGRDLAWGLCWFVVLYAAFAIGFLAPLLLAGGPSGIADGSVFEEAFVGVWAEMESTAFGPFTLGLFTVWMAVFPFLNAPVEELQYRAYVQPRLHAATGRAWLAVAVPSIGFGLQHLLFAPSALGAVAYASAFLLWGGGAGLIYLRQRRLMPLVLAHLITNIPVTFVALAFLFWP
ncbi:CPBP family intramembrane metalloprotease [Egibacter rhizosphaerae]|uniref:CPBP family intramembrane metalloprotease n=1 Tax=Egibacter rhizosphaerae TaxID=1670831 RepID=A0A411YAD8_9ACTN|nr:CPBP family intramembrane glutamic endopeptidase [Egibacter rhizosphaerae]QBI18148.1 CPBP family intramembrane metalloprotease [Egibacter rhizosphaerae]